MGNNNTEFLDFWLREKRIYYTGWNCNGLFSYDWDEDKAHYHGLLPGNAMGSVLYGNPLEYRNKIYLPPMHSDSIVEIDADSMKIKEYKVNDDIIGAHAIRYREIFDAGDILCLLPYMAKKLCFFNANSNEIKYRSLLSEKTEDRFSGGEYYPVFWAATVGERVVFLSMYKSGRLLRHRLDDPKVDDFFGEEKNYGALLHDGRLLWAYARDERCVDIYYEDEITEKINISRFDPSEGVGLYENDNGVWFTSQKGDCLIRIDKNSFEVTEIGIKADKPIDSKRGGLLKFYNDYIYYSPLDSSSIVRIFQSDFRAESRNMLLSKSEKRRFDRDRIDKMTREGLSMPDDLSVLLGGLQDD